MLQINENNYSGFILLIMHIHDSCIENPSGQITWNISTEFQVGTIKMEETSRKMSVPTIKNPGV